MAAHLQEENIKLNYYSFWAVTPCSLVNGYQISEEDCVSLLGELTLMLG